MRLDKCAYGNPYTGLADQITAKIKVENDDGESYEMVEKAFVIEDDPSGLVAGCIPRELFYLVLLVIFVPFYGNITNISNNCIYCKQR